MTKWKANVKLMWSYNKSSEEDNKNNKERKMIIEIDQYSKYNGNTNNSNISINNSHISKSNVNTFQ